MFDNSQTKKTRHKVMMQVELDDGSERLMSLFVAPGTRVEVGFTENIVNQQTTADFGMWFGVEHVW